MTTSLTLMPSNISEMGVSCNCNVFSAKKSLMLPLMAPITCHVISLPLYFTGSLLKV